MTGAQNTNKRMTDEASHKGKDQNLKELKSTIWEIIHKKLLSRKLLLSSFSNDERSQLIGFYNVLGER